jgi:benzil reductase ((S)-benzoin forming)
MSIRIALISGGSKGLGLSLCRYYQHRGYQVIDFSRSAPHAFSVAVDFSQPEESRLAVAAALRAILQQPIEELLVISNAGAIAPIGPVSKKSTQEILQHVHINFTSAILFISEVIAQAQDIACRKVIANISSGAAHGGLAGWSLYCASKAGMLNFIRALAAEQKTAAQPFVAININPGVMDTDMQANIRSASASDFPDVARFIERQAQGELAPAAEVADAVGRILALSSFESGDWYDVSDYAQAS